MDAGDLRVIQCNYRVATSVCSKGARAYLSTVSGDDRKQVIARSRSGRWVRRWEKRENLYNFRLKTLVADDPVRKLFPVGISDFSEEHGQLICNNLNSEANDAN